MKPDKFDAKRVPLYTLLIQFETCSRYNWSEDEKLAQMKCSLAGDAAQILLDCPNANKMSFAELVNKLKARYGTTGLCRTIFLNVSPLVKTIGFI
jgi:hypothetical protein